MKVKIVAGSFESFLNNLMLQTSSGVARFFWGGASETNIHNGHP